MKPTEIVDIGEYILANQASLQRWGDEIASVVIAQHGLKLKVPAQVRVKQPTSAKAKQMRKAYGDPLVQMTDLVGVRFVVLTTDDLKPIRTTIEQHPDWSVLQARDPDAEIEKNPALFGYQSHHYEVRRVGGHDSNGGAIACEVQVRTLLQHAYAELTHDTIYKTDQAVPSHAERLISRSMALMETTDELLCKAIDAVRLANAPALALQAAAARCTSALGGPSPRIVLDALAEAFREHIGPQSARELNAFVEGNDWIIEKVGSRLGRGLFAFPDAALIAYWLASQIDEAVLTNWPLPGSVADVQRILSDMGIGSPSH